MTKFDFLNDLIEEVLGGSSVDWDVREDPDIENRFSIELIPESEYIDMWLPVEDLESHLVTGLTSIHEIDKLHCTLFVDILDQTIKDFELVN